MSSESKPSSLKKEGESDSTGRQILFGLYLGFSQILLRAFFSLWFSRTVALGLSMSVLFLGMYLTFGWWKRPQVKQRLGRWPFLKYLLICIGVGVLSFLFGRTFPTLVPE